MFRYNPETQTYSMSLFEEEPQVEVFSVAEEKQKQLQEVTLRSTFKIITEAPFHDLWFCEAQDCEASFWFGGKHHCRMCGNTVCEEHCLTNVVLSTHLMPVIEDKLPNVTLPILAASKTELPETIEFKRACLSCCEKAKNVPRKQSLEEEKRRKRQAKKEAQEKERLSESHWTADKELSSKIHAMKAKKLAWNRATVHRHQKGSSSDTETEDAVEESPQEQKQPEMSTPPHSQYVHTATKQNMSQQMTERAERRLRAARAAQEAALRSNLQRKAQLEENEERIAHQREEVMTPAELALYRKQREREKAEKAKAEIENRVNDAKGKMQSGMLKVFFSMAKRAEIEAQQKELIEVQAAASKALSKSTSHIFDRLTLNKEFYLAKESGDEEAVRNASVALIALVWRSKVDKRHRAALKVRRENLLRTVSLGRLQAWWRVMLGKVRAHRMQALKLNLQASGEEVIRIRVLDLMSVTNMAGIRYIVDKLIAVVRLRLRIARLPGVLVVEQATATAPAAKQHLIVHLQSGLNNLDTVHASGRAALLARSKSESIYISKAIGAAEEGVFTEKCFLTQVPVNGVLGVTLVNPDSYTQTLITLGNHPSLMKVKTVTTMKLPVEVNVCPILNSANKSELPAKSKRTSTAAVPSLQSLRFRMLPFAASQAGRVQKQAHSVLGEFKSRYLVLAEGRLLYFDDSSQLHKPRGVIICKNITTFAFGPDKVPDGELTLHVADQHESWYLRFPKYGGKTAVSAWLRKIQYACPQVRLNDSQKGFVERIEQMSRLYTFPVLRPVAPNRPLSRIFSQRGAAALFPHSRSPRPESTASAASTPSVSGGNRSPRVVSTPTSAAVTTPAAKQTASPTPAARSVAVNAPSAKKVDPIRRLTSWEAMLPPASVAATVPAKQTAVSRGSTASALSPAQPSKAAIRRASTNDMYNHTTTSALPASSARLSLLLPEKAPKPDHLRRASFCSTPVSASLSQLTIPSVNGLDQAARSPPSKPVKPEHLRRGSDCPTPVATAVVSPNHISSPTSESSGSPRSEPEASVDLSPAVPVVVPELTTVKPTPSTPLSSFLAARRRSPDSDSEAHRDAASSNTSLLRQQEQSPYQPRVNPLQQRRSFRVDNLTRTEDTTSAAAVASNVPAEESVQWSDDSDADDPVRRSLAVLRTAKTQADTLLYSDDDYEDNVDKDGESVVQGEVVGESTVPPMQHLEDTDKLLNMEFPELEGTPSDSRVSVLVSSSIVVDVAVPVSPTATSDGNLTPSGVDGSKKNKKKKKSKKK